MTLAIAGIREIPHSCSCDWQGPDYRLPPRQRRYSLPQPDPDCGFHRPRQAPAPRPAVTAARPAAAAPRPRPSLPGPMQMLVLEAVAAHEEGCAVTVLADALGRGRTAVDSAVRILRDRGLIRVLTYERRAGKPAAVYVISTAGQAALDAARETAA